MRRVLFLLPILLFSTALPVRAANIEAQNYRRAFALLDAGHADTAYDMAERGRDPILNKVLLGYYMAAPGNDISFAQMSDFIARNPDWPGLRDIRAIAEQKIPADATPAQITSWFSAHAPVTLAGFYRYIDALNMNGQSQEALRLVRERWINGEFTGDELVAFDTRFGGFLTPEDHWARLDRLLWNGDGGGAHRMYAFVDGEHRLIADARLALAGQRPDAQYLLEQANAAGRGDPGLIYENLRWLRRNNRDDEAVEILDRPPANPEKPEAWWDERNIEARRAMDKQDYRLAARLVFAHEEGLPNKGFAQAEFLAGWLALRFLNQPEDARAHFQALSDRAGTPISRARGDYWLGRTFEALGDKPNAEQAYESAAALNTTYYGQLAATRLYTEPMIAARPEPAIPAPVRDRFFARDAVRAVEHLHAIGERDRAHAFFKAATDYATQRADFVLLTELAYQIRRPDFAIEAAKAANIKNMLVAAGGFPVLGSNIPSPPEPAFTHALIRQESMFNPDAQSPAGAKGLMQLMPATAKAVAKKLGIRFKASRLGESDYNLRLGTAFVQDQIDMFDGSYVLALAGYNAGPHRAREWISQIGDPRDPKVDVVDWIELVPVPETRNYIQRIIENLQIYRARLNGGQAPLRILEDLKR